MGTTTLLTSLTIALFLQLFALNIVPTSAAGGIGSYCSSYADCDQRKLLECHRERNTCDCALNSVFSGVQGKCVQRVGERCIIHINKVGGPLPEVGCVDNARCEREPNSRRAFNQGVCTCSHGYYRTADNFCHARPTITSSSSTSNNKYSPSLDNVVSSMSSQDSKSTSSYSQNQKKDPDPYHHPLTRSSSVSYYYNSNTQIMSLSLITIIAIFMLNS